MDDTQFYRGAFVRVWRGGKETIVYSNRTYTEPRYAKTWVSVRRNKLGSSFKEGWIERATGWERVED
jgi:hypothetical protein